MGLGHGGLLPGARWEPARLPLHPRDVLRGEMRDGEHFSGITPSLHQH